MYFSDANEMSCPCFHSLSPGLAPSQQGLRDEGHPQGHRFMFLSASEPKASEPSTDPAHSHYRAEGMWDSNVSKDWSLCQQFILSAVEGLLQVNPMSWWFPAPVVPLLKVS